MFNFTHRRIRLALVIALAAALGTACWHFTVVFLAARQMQFAQQALRHGNFTEAGAHLDSYLGLRPGDGEAQLLAARTARRANDFTLADRHLQLAVKAGANAEEVSLERALNRIQRGDLAHQDAHVNFCRANPNSRKTKDLLEALIEGSVRAGQLPLRTWSISEWLKLSTRGGDKLDLARGKLWAADLLILLGQRALSYDYCREAAELAPDYVPARFALASVLVHDDPHQAGPEMEWLRQHMPPSPSFRLLLAQWRRRLGELDVAATLLDELLQAQPDNVEALIERGRVALDQGQAPEAEHWLARAEKLSADNYEVNVAMGACLRLAGRLDEAKSYQDKARAHNEQLRGYLETFVKNGSAASPQPK